MEEYMAERKAPGGQLAVGRGNSILFSKGFGLADREKGIAVTPRTLFRIASVTKPLTAVAVLTLVEQGKLTLDTKMQDVLKIAADPTPGDARLADIAVRHLLQHTAGWDRDRSGDPMFQSRQIAKKLGIACPPGPRDIIRDMLSRPLDEAPGVRYAYSNFGYCVLGRIIENLSGGTYEQYVREHVLKPAGVTAARLGATLHTAENESHYYMAAESKEDMEGKPVFPDLPDKVPSPCGRWSLEAMDAHGAWIACAEDMVRFAMSLTDIGKTTPFRKQETWEMLIAPPPGAPGHDAAGAVKADFYACGFRVLRKDKGVSLTHAGSLPGTTTFLWRRADGLTWAAFFNQRWSEKNDRAIEPTINSVLDGAGDWK